MRLSSTAAKEDQNTATRRSSQPISSAHGYGRKAGMAYPDGGSPAGRRTGAPGVYSTCCVKRPQLCCSRALQCRSSMMLATWLHKHVRASKHNTDDEAGAMCCVQPHHAGGGLSDSINFQVLQHLESVFRWDALRQQPRQQLSMPAKLLS